MATRQFEAIYGDMTYDEIEEWFRIGWWDYKKKVPLDNNLPYAWQEGWIKAQRSDIQLLKAKYDTQKATPGGDDPF